MTSLAQPASGLFSCFGEACRFFLKARRVGLLSRSRPTLVRGFSLVEMMVVLAIIAILSSMLLLSIAGVKTSRELAKATYDIQGVLEQARTLAMASNTYTWVGFFEETQGTPGVAGTGQLVISVVSSVDGTKLYPTGTPPAQLPSASMTQVAKLLRIPNLHLDDFFDAPPAVLPTLPSVLVATNEVGSSTFATTTNFIYPLGATTPQYTFTRVIQFSPQGDATRIGNYPAQLTEISLRPSHGATIATTSTDIAAIQIAGIGGRVAVYRP